MKFLQITDTHLVPAGGRLKDLDPEARLMPLFDDIDRFHADAELCVITGDLAVSGLLRLAETPALLVEKSLPKLPH